MSKLDLPIIWQILLGIYLIFHGLIHISVAKYTHNEEKNQYTGWSGKSWLLSGRLDNQTVEFFGRTLWIAIVFVFVAGGVAVLGLPLLNEWSTTILLIGSWLAVVAYILMFNGLAPNPQSWLIGVAIDIIIILYITFFQESYQIVMFALFACALLGFIIVFVTKILPEFGREA